MISSTCACRIDGTSKYSPAAAVPVRTKIPEPMMAPMPSAVSVHGPSVFFSRCSGFSESEISLSIDLQQNSWLLGGAHERSVGWRLDWSVVVTMSRSSS